MSDGKEKFEHQVEAQVENLNNTSRGQSSNGSALNTSRDQEIASQLIQYQSTPVISRDNLDASRSITGDLLIDDASVSAHSQDLSTRMVTFAGQIPSDSDLAPGLSSKGHLSRSQETSLGRSDVSHCFSSTSINPVSINNYHIARSNLQHTLVTGSDAINQSPHGTLKTNAAEKCFKPPPQVFNALLNSANLLSLRGDTHANTDIITSDSIEDSKVGAPEQAIGTDSGIEICPMPSMIEVAPSNDVKSNNLSDTEHNYSEQSDTPSSVSLCYSSSGQLMQLNDLCQNEPQSQQEQQQQQQQQPQSAQQQHHTYVLLQAPVDGDPSAQPQMFLAMQTSQESSQHQYITLHPVTMDSNDESMTMVNTDSLNISQSVLNSHGTSDINSCDVNKPRGLNENSQVVLNLHGQHALLPNNGTTQENGHQSMVTYLQPLGGQSMQSQGQVLIAASDVQGNLTLHNVQGNGLGARKILSGRSSGNVTVSSSRRRLSTDPRSCEQCGRTFKYPSDLKKHLQIHTDIKKFRCDECSRCFRRLHQLEVHRRIHTGEKPYVCNRCGAQFRHDSTLTMHIRTRHDHLKPFSCDGCAKKFGRMSHLRKHQRNVCGRTNMRSGALCVCKYCDVAFTKKADLKVHIISSCEKRPERTITINPAAIDGKELIVPMFICETCGKEFSRLYDFKRHQLTHSDDKPFLCPQCGKSFKERSSLNKHVKRMHCSDGDGTIPIDDDGIDIHDDDGEDEDEISCDEKDATDIIVSIDGKDLGSTDQFSPNTSSLAQAGIMTNSNGQIVTANGQTISASDILNFPEVAAALGLDVTNQSAVVNVEENSSILSIPSQANLETSEVPMDIEQSITQEGSLVVTEIQTTRSDGLVRQTNLKLHTSLDKLSMSAPYETRVSATENIICESQISGNNTVYNVQSVAENDANYKQREESGFSDHAQAIAQAEKAAAHDLLPEQILQEDENAQAALIVSNR